MKVTLDLAIKSFYSAVKPEAYAAPVNDLWHRLRSVSFVLEFGALSIQESKLWPAAK
jgi:hypothetical protein